MVLRELWAKTGGRGEREKEVRAQLYSCFVNLLWR